MAPSDPAAPHAVPAYRPVTFALDGETCLFGWLHPPRPSMARSCAVVLCNPFAEAALSTHRSYRSLAEALAGAGYPTLRFDYHGTGDSAGGDADPARVRHWLASVHAAVDTCKRLSGVAEVALFGVRLGGTLAAMAAAERGDVAALMLWAPVVSGRRFVRELKMLRATNRLEIAATAGVTSPAPFDGLEAAGFRHSAETLADLGALDLLKLPPPAVPVALLDRDDVVAEPDLEDFWRGAGTPLQGLPLPGYAAMMRDAQYAIVPTLVIAGLLEWLQATRPAMGAPPLPASPAPAPAPLRTFAPTIDDAAPVPIAEHPVWFGAAGELFGILSRPDGAAGGAPASLADTAVILINAGGNHRIGPSRLTVPLARYLASLGCTTLRMDLAGLGDSVPVFETLPVFDVSSVADVTQAIDYLSARPEFPTRHFVTVGLCSGGFIALHAAIRDARIQGQVVINLPAFEANRNASVERVAKLYIKPLSYYSRAILQFDTWRRAVSGRVDLRRILVAGFSMLLKRLRIQRQALLANLRMTRDRSIAAQFRQLGRRKVRSLLVLSANDSAVDEMETHLGKNASRMHREPNFRCVVLDGADHTFTADVSRRSLLSLLRVHFEGFAS